MTANYLPEQNYLTKEWEVILFSCVLVSSVFLNQGS